MALVWTHLPPMAGDRRGVALRSETGAENVTEIVVFGATFCAPGAGLVAFRKNCFAGDRLEPESDEPRTRSPSRGCVEAGRSPWRDTAQRRR